ncbi:MAG: MATE family efflux transporter [Sphaerochaetaceae bacterium]|nr:MATE family efflux transporter [Sphaerochaetaceae bacterium]
MIDTSNRLGRENMVSLVIRMALPIMLSMALQAVYNIADSLFISRYSLSAFAGVSVIQPFSQIVISIAVGLAAGLSGVLSNSLGRRDDKRAFDSIRSAKIIAIYISFIFLFLMEILSTPFVYFFVKEEVAYNSGVEYLRIFSLGLPLLFIMNILSSILQSHSRSRDAMLVQSSGCIVNIVLDPLLIFTFDLGARGAAIATVLGFLVSALFGVVLVKRLSIVKGSFSLPLVWKIIYIGLPTLLVSGAGPIISIFYNKLVIQYGVDAMIAYGMYLKMESFMFLSASGVSSALIVIAAYNLGEGKLDRVHSAYNVSLFIGWGTMLLGFLLFQLFPGFFVHLFTSEGGELYLLGITAFHYLSFCFLISPFNIVTSGLFQGLGQGARGMVIIAVRFFVFLLPYSFILSHFFGLKGLFLSYFAADMTNFLHVYIQKELAFKSVEKSKF